MKQYVPTFESFLFEGRTRKKQKDWTYDDNVILYYVAIHGFDLADASDAIKSLTDEESFYMRNLGADPSTIPYHINTITSNKFQQSNHLKKVIAKYKNLSKSELLDDVDEILNNLTEKQKKKNFNVANKYVKINYKNKTGAAARAEEARLALLDKQYNAATKSGKTIYPETPYVVGDIATHRTHGYGEVLSIAVDNIMIIKFKKKAMPMIYKEKNFIDPPAFKK
jgi:hypothetical protein